jgi:hypothetical protein
MNVDEYRKAYAAQLARTKVPERARVPRTRSSVNSPETAGFVVAAPAPLSGTDELSEEIQILADPSFPPRSRVQALRAVQAATFLGPAFDQYRPAYLEALRSAARAKNLELKELALEILAIEKDEVARSILIDSLSGQARPQIPTRKAIQLLAYDDHDAAVPIARQIVEGDHDTETKLEAMRVLAADPGSTDLFASTLSDTAESQELRSASAAGLRMLDPERFQKEATRIVGDPSESDEVRASCLGALANMQSVRGRAGGGDSFVDTVAKLTSEQPGVLSAAAGRFMRKRDSK